MSKLTAYKCLECGHFTISRHDGHRCAKCDGPVMPQGNATYVEGSSIFSIPIETGMSERLTKQEINTDQQIALARRIMLDKMNLLAVVDGKVGESTVNRLENEVDVISSIIQTLKGNKTNVT